MTTKKCRACKARKSLDEFNRRQQAKDGRQSYCRECSRGYRRKWGKDTNYSGYYPQVTRVFNARKRAKRLGVANALTVGQWYSHIEKLSLCEYCNEREPEEMDHRLPMGLGGPNVIFNVAYVCKPCHDEKTLIDQAEIRAARASKAA